MKLTRFCLEDLKRWAQSATRLPLLMQGARQTGKTWLLKELGSQCFEHTAYFDFAERPELQSIFAQSRNAEKILEGLRFISDVSIVPGRTLIVFDEIQLCDAAFGSLKYFAQEAPQYAVAAAGSLLGVAVRRKNIFAPVGQVTIRHLESLSFSEYLCNAAPKLYEFINAINSLNEIPDYVFTQLVNEYKKYQCIGGMPQAVLAALSQKEISVIDNILKDILQLYRADFSQYVNTTESVRISQIWDAIPSQLAKENSRFFLSRINKNARSREYETALQWLIDSGLILKVKHVSSPEMPLAAYEDAGIFKIYLSDIGLLRSLSRLPAQTLLQPNESFKEYKGALAENFIAVSLNRQLGYPPSYWSSGESAEVDFLVQADRGIVPIEVKSGTSITGKSLNVYRKRYQPAMSVRFSMRNLERSEGFMNIPLPLADWALKFIDGQYAGD